MDSAMYSFPPGGVSRRGTGVTSSIPWFARTAQASMPMWDDPPPDVESADPHDDGFSTGPFEAGPTAENITGGGDFPVAAEFDQSGGEFDVTPGAFDVDAAYDRGGNGVDEGPIADNIHVD